MAAKSIDSTKYRMILRATGFETRTFLMQELQKSNLDGVVAIVALGYGHRPFHRLVSHRTESGQSLAECCCHATHERPIAFSHPVDSIQVSRCQLSDPCASRWCRGSRCQSAEHGQPAEIRLAIAHNHAHLHVFSTNGLCTLPALPSRA